jgi:hypothetical protein
LSCYGSSWNATETIDRVASRGAVWDRLIATSDRPIDVLSEWLMPPASHRWQDRYRDVGSVELFTDEPGVFDRGLGEAMDAATLIEPQDLSTSADDATDDAGSTSVSQLEPSAVTESGHLEETRFGRLVAAALDRLRQGEPWGALWLHSGCLRRAWDAPRSLFPTEELEEEWEADIDEAQSGEAGVTGSEASIGSPPEEVPAIFDQREPPCFQLDDAAHPDLVMSWMRTYGCQVRLVDLLLRLLTTAVESVDPTVVVLGTSGMALGQSRWIGHRCGPVRSTQIRLPVIMGRGAPVRSGRLTPSSAVAERLARLADPDPVLISPGEWTGSDGEFNAVVETRSDRARRVINTGKWFCVRDDRGDASLFLKPDDVDDVNDVSRLRGDVLEQLE